MATFRGSRVIAITFTPEVFVKRRFYVNLDPVYTELVTIIQILLTIFVIVDPTDFTSSAKVVFRRKILFEKKIKRKKSKMNFLL